MLDTDSVSYAIRGKGRVAQNIVGHAPSELCLSAITLAELRYGVDLLGSRRIHRAIDAFIRPLSVIPFDAECAATYGRVGAALSVKGVAIGDSATLIAAHALTLGLTLVTNNQKHFHRVAGLKITSWL